MRGLSVAVAKGLVESTLCILWKYLFRFRPLVYVFFWRCPQETLEQSLNTEWHIVSPVKNTSELCVSVSIRFAHKRAFCISYAPEERYFYTNHMVTTLNGNIFRVTGPLWRESTGHRWTLPLNKLLSETPVISDAVALIMTSPMICKNVVVLISTNNVINLGSLMISWKSLFIRTIICCCILWYTRRSRVPTTRRQNPGHSTIHIVIVGYR